MSGRFSRKRRNKQMNAQREKAMGSMDNTIKHFEAMIAALKANKAPWPDPLPPPVDEAERKRRDITFMENTGFNPHWRGNEVGT